MSSSYYRHGFQDDFVGAGVAAHHWQLNDVAGAGALAYPPFAGGIVEVQTGGNLNDESQLRSLGGVGRYLTSKNFVCEVRLAAVIATSYNMYVSMYNGLNEFIKLEFGTDTPNGAISTTRTGGNSTTNNITHSHDTNMHVATIVGRSSSVKFLIDGTLKQEHTTHITASYLHPLVGIKTLDATPNARPVDIDYVFLSSDRDA